MSGDVVFSLHKRSSTGLDFYRGFEAQGEIPELYGGHPKARYVIVGEAIIDFVGTPTVAVFVVKENGKLRRYRLR